MEHRRQIEALRNEARERLGRLRAEQEGEWEKRRSAVLKSSREPLHVASTRRGRKSVMDEFRVVRSAEVTAKPPTRDRAPVFTPAPLPKHAWDQRLSPRLRKICSKIIPSSPAITSNLDESQHWHRQNTIPIVQPQHLADPKPTRNEAKIPATRVTLPKLRKKQPTGNPASLQTSSGDTQGGCGGGGEDKAAHARKGSMTSLKFPPENWRAREKANSNHMPKGRMLHSKRAMVQRASTACPVSVQSEQILDQLVAKQNSGYYKMMKTKSTSENEVPCIAPCNSAPSAADITNDDSCKYIDIQKETRSGSSESEKYYGKGTSLLDSDPKISEDDSCRKDPTYDHEPLLNEDLNKSQHQQQLPMSRDGKEKQDSFPEEENKQQKCNIKAQMSFSQGDSLDWQTSESSDSSSDDKSCCSEDAVISGRKHLECDAIDDRSDSATLRDLAKWYERYPSTPVSYWQHSESPVTSTTCALTYITL